MPFINTKTNTDIPKEKEEIIKAKFGKAIASLGKSEGWLMLNFEDNCRLWFKGDNSKKMAISHVSLFGRASDSAYEKMTRQITDILSEELDILPDCIYVKYDEVDTWGWNGDNF